MAGAKLSGERLLADTLGIPETLRRVLPEASLEIHRSLSGVNVDPINTMFLGGSGDLLHAALCMRFAFQRLTGITTIATPSMQLGLYETPSFSSETVTLQMSFSGVASRAVEAGTLAKARPGPVWSLTANPNSALAKLADLHFRKPDTGDNEAVGFQITMVMLLLIGSKLAEMRQRITRAEAKRLEDIVLQATDQMAATLEACSCPARAWAVEFVEAQNILFLGSGPCYGTAVNASARIMEASGKSASAQDIEEWVHLERWVADKSLPVVLIVPAGPAMDRAIEVARALKALGKPCLAVTDSAYVEQFSSFAETVLSVRCSLPEELAPLVYNLPTELVADHLSIAGSKTPYCGDDVLYNQLGEPRSGGFVRKTVPPVGLPIGCV